MADGALHLARRRVEAFGDLGIQPLGDAVDDLGICDSHLDRFSEELIPLDMRGDPHRDKDIRDPFVEEAVLRGTEGQGGRRDAHDLVDPIFQREETDGLQHKVTRAALHRAEGIFVSADRGQGDKLCP